MKEIGSEAAFEAGLPASPEYENILLYDCMETDSTLEACTALLGDDDFTTIGRKQIWRAVQKLSEEGIQPTHRSVYAYLIDLGTPSSISHPAFEDHQKFVLVQATAERYCRVLRRRTAQRRALVAATELIQDAATSTVGDIEAKLERVLEDIRKAADRSEVKCSVEVVEEMGGIEAFVGNRETPAVPLPWAEPLEGLHRGEMTVLGARPGVGKSAAACAIAGACCKSGLRVHYWSLEMSSGLILRRIMSNIHGIRLSDFRHGSLNVMEKYEIHASLERIKESLALMDGAQASAAEVLRQVETEAKVGKPPDLVIIDYLQLMEGAGENRNLQISKITRSLKRLTLKYPVALLVLAQLSRDGEKAGSREPQLSDLRDSGSIEQDADNVVFLHPTSGDLGAPVQEVKWLVKKQRNGTTGVIHLAFDRSRMQFAEVQNA